MAIIENASSEQAILSTCINNLDKGWIGHTSREGGTHPETLFNDEKNSAVFSVLHNLVAEGKNVAIPVVIDTLDTKYPSLFPDGSKKYIRSIQLVPGISNLNTFNDVLEGLIRSRSLRKQRKEIELVFSDINDPSIDTVPADVAERLKEIISDTEVSSDAQTFGEVTSEILNSPRPMWTQPTGIEELDNALGGKGFESGTLTVVAARPKVGKTVFMNDMIYRTLREGNYPLVFNYETKKIEFLAKMISRHIGDSSIGWGKIKAFISKDEEIIVSSSEANKIKEGIQWAENQGWYVIFDKTTSMPDMEGLIMRAKADAPEGANIVVFVDYLQLQITDSSKTVEQISDLTRFYKLVSGTYDVAVVLLSQLNRGPESDKPKIYHLRGSGSIEQDADVVLLLDTPYRRKESTDPHVLEIDAGTSRLAQGGEFQLFIDGACQFIDERDEDYQDRTELDVDYIEEIEGFKTDV